LRRLHGHHEQQGWSIAATVLAIDAQGKKIQNYRRNLPPVPNRTLSAVAFVNNDGQQCGYCTPGFVMAAKGFLDHNPNPTYETGEEGSRRQSLRCGTYVGVRKAVLEAAQK